MGTLIRMESDKGKLPGLVAAPTSVQRNVDGQGLQQLMALNAHHRPCHLASRATRPSSTMPADTVPAAMSKAMTTSQRRLAQ